MKYPRYSEYVVLDRIGHFKLFDLFLIVCFKNVCFYNIYKYALMYK